MKAVVFAYHQIGFVCLEELISFGVDVLCLVTHEEDPEEEIWFKTPAFLAKATGIPVLTPEDGKDPFLVQYIRGLSPDIIFSFYYRQMIPLEILKIPPIGAFNLHGSLLPKFRGRVPVNWAIIEGEKETGLTLHAMVEKPDAGDIVIQRKVAIDFEDTAYSLFMKLVDLARPLMREILPKLADGTFQRTPQQGPSSYFGGRKPEDGLIDWKKDAVSIYNLVRAVTHPYPGAFGYLGGRKLFIWKAYPQKESSFLSPGDVVSERPFLISTGSGTLRLVRVQLEGAEEEDGDQFAARQRMQNKKIGGAG